MSGGNVKLTRDQRSRLLAGDYSALRFDAKPDIGPCCIVLSWARAFSVDDGHGNSKRVPREPLLWIEVTEVLRRNKGGWAVRFDICDRRHPKRLPRRVPPRYDEALMRQDQQRHPSQSETSLASEQSNYTSNASSAVDHLDGVPREWTPTDATLLHRKQNQIAKDHARRSLSIGAQVDSYLRDAKEAGVDTSKREKTIRRELELLAKERERVA